jgi:N-acetylmuramoyl-L-alanine amidase
MGIIADISKYQGNINFDLLKNVVDGVILRVQAGSTYADPMYQTYVSECKRVGIPFGTYAYFKGVNVNDAIQEAKDAYARMDKSSACFALDIEEVTMSDLVSGGQAFIDYLHQQGVQHVGLYSGEYFYNSHNLGAIRCDWHWIAKYGVNDGQQHTQPSVDDDLWQFTSVGHLQGISGNVDENVITDGNHFNFFGSHTIVAPPITPSNLHADMSTILQHVKALVVTDIRNTPSHASGFIRNTSVGEVFPVYARQGDWHFIGWNPKDGDCWIDGNGGNNLYWVDNPNNKSNPQPTSSVHVVVKDETLGKIASANGTTVANLCRLNGIKDPDKIYIGQKITLK